MFVRHPNSTLLCLNNNKNEINLNSFLIEVIKIFSEIKIDASITPVIYYIKLYKKRVFKTILKVIIFVSTYNPQITKAHVNKLHKSKITLNSGLSMQVGISEAIRMLFFFRQKIFL